MRVKNLMVVICLICADFLSAQINHYVIDTSFDTEEYFSPGTVRSIVLRDEYDDMYINYSRHQGISEAHQQCIINFEGDLMINIFDDHTLETSRYLSGTLMTGYGGATYSVLTTPPYPEPARTVISNLAYSDEVYSFQGFNRNSRGHYILEDSSFLVAGRFTTDSMNPGPQGIRHLIRADSTGAPVPGFPDIICDPLHSIVYDIHKAIDGTYWMLGQFSGVNGHPTNKVAHLNSDFTLDTTYTSPFINENGTNWLELEDSEGNLWVTCTSGCNTVDQEIDDRALIKLTPDGSIHSGFTIPDMTTYVMSGSDLEWKSPPSVVMEDTDGLFIIGGSIMKYNGTEVNRLLKITPDGELIPEAFEGLGADEAVWPNWTPGSGDLVGTTITQIERQADGKLLVGGLFSSFGGEPYKSLVRLEQDGYLSVESVSFEETDLKIWPNPTKHYIEWNQNIDAVVLYNSLGQAVLSKNSLQGQKRLNLPVLPQGIYRLQCISNNRTSIHSLIIK